MATATKNTKTAEQKKAARSASAKKAAETRKANKAQKQQKAQVIEAQDQAEQEQKDVKAAVALTAAPLKICDVICETLRLIRPGTENYERPEGYTYRECLEMVLARVRVEQPDAKTSLDCLRWYATKMRSEQEVLPLRPRNTPVRKAKPEVDPTE